MLTRLRVSGFKNLLDVDVSFGPFTCIAGANGVGKSNLFDAIAFLSALADHSLRDAAHSIRNDQARSSDTRSLFHRIADSCESSMSFDAEMLIPSDGEDDLRQPAHASRTFVRYKLVLGLKQVSSTGPSGELQVLQEELTHIGTGEAPRRLSFPHTGAWLKSVVKGVRTRPFISTDSKGGQTMIRLHQDGGPGRVKSFLATTIPRTVFSTTNAAESPTAVLARTEMRSWRLLQLEPSALRAPDPFTAPARLSPNGAHMPATLFRLMRGFSEGGPQSVRAKGIRATISNRVAELIDDVGGVSVDRDDKRELLTLLVTDRQGTTYAAHSLSDGTLRFLSLAILESDPEATGLLCLEEPENGIHPERMKAMMDLLEDLALDPNLPIGDDNPLRQVIISTHSPILVGESPDDSLLIAQSKEVVRGDGFTSAARFSWLPDTWRHGAHPDVPPVSRGHLLACLNPYGGFHAAERPVAYGGSPGQARRRVVDRSDIQQHILFPGSE